MTRGDGDSERAPHASSEPGEVEARRRWPLELTPRAAWLNGEDALKHGGWRPIARRRVDEPAPPGRAGAVNRGGTTEQFCPSLRGRAFFFPERRQTAFAGGGTYDG